MTWIGGEHDRGLPRAGGPAPDGPEVVLDVAARPLRRRCDGLDRPLALELAQDLLVRAADDVREDVQASTVGHPDHDLVRARLGGELGRLVEHRHEHVEALDRELLLAEEGAAQVPLHPLDLRQPGQQELLLLGRERRAVPAGLDRLAQPHTLLVVGDVLELVRARAAVDGPERRKRLAQRLARNVGAEDPRRNLRLELGGEPRDHPLGL